MVIKQDVSFTQLVKNNGYNQPEIAKMMNKSLTYVSNRATMKEPWTMDDVIFLSDLFGLSDDELLQTFAHPSDKMKRRKKK